MRADIVKQGYMAVSNADLFYPAVAIGPNGKGAISFTLSGVDYFPSVAYATLSESGSGEVQILAAGTTPHDGSSGYRYFGGGGSARTGDYSAATVDEHGAVWMASEYIAIGPRTLLANWGTLIAQITPAK